MTLRDSIRGHPLAAFFLLAYGFSWAFWIAMGILYPPTLPPARRAPGQALAIVGTFGPFVAAAVVAWATGTGDEFKERLLRWRVAPRWYLVAVGLPLVVVAGGYAVYRLRGGPPVDPSRTFPASALAVTFVLTLLVGGGNEEPGWRGFALPRLRRIYGPISGTLVLAVFWAGWHLPAFLDPNSLQSVLPPTAWLLGLVATSIVLTWLFAAAAESVPVVALYHATYNVAGIWVISGLPFDAMSEFYWTGTAVYAVVVVGLLVATRFALGAAPDTNAAETGYRERAGLR